MSWGPWTCRTSQTSQCGRGRPTRTARNGARIGRVSYPTLTNVAAPTRRHERTFPRKRRPRLRPASAPTRPTGRGYWDEVPRFLKLRAEHEKDWRTKRRAPWTVRRPAGRPKRRGLRSPLNGMRRDDAIREVREPSRPSRRTSQAIERENTYGCWLEGFKNRLKGEDRLKEKVAERAGRSCRDRPPAEALREMPDAIRYTFCFQPENYTKGYYDIKERLESRGYEMYYRRTTGRTPNTKGSTPAGSPRRGSASRCSSTRRKASTPSST